jgi:RNA polymerase sigma-70 factor (ECF subfamily)
VAFEFGYPQIAEILGRSPADCRQLLHRATERVGGTARFTAEPTQHAALLRRFLAAAQDGDVPGLTALLRDDATAWSDGGGMARAGRHPIRGRDKVARLFSALGTRWPLRRVLELRVNGGPALAIWRKAGPQLWTVRATGGQLTDVYLTLNPDKLRSVPQLWEP